MRRVCLKHICSNITLQRLPCECMRSNHRARGYRFVDRKYLLQKVIKKNKYKLNSSVANMIVL